MPETVVYDNELDTAIRQGLAEVKAPKNIANKCFEIYCDIMNKRHEAIDKQSKEAEENLRKELGEEAFERIIGTEEKPGQIKNWLVQLSKDLQMDYVDEDGKMQSLLIDDLEMVGEKGVYGDKPNLIKALHNLLKYRYEEGTTHLGKEPVGVPKKSKETFSDEWYKETEPGED